MSLLKSIKQYMKTGNIKFTYHITRNMYVL